MDKQGNENLSELLARFMNEQDARQAADDIEKGDKLLSRYPAHEPGEEALARIKGRVAQALNQRHAIGIRRRVWAVAAAAAVVLLASALTLKLFERQPTPTERARYASVIPASVWDGNDIKTDDVDIAVMVAEIETIENELFALNLDDDGGNGNGAVGDLEIELMEVGGDFWKG